ncbi:MAG: molybdate transport system substrate-binding protein, partial [Mycobacterium sp.]|nr:molybdate transport system substrate-binding protein [Mycobacterium sp.]
MRRSGILAGLVSTMLVAVLVGCSAKSPSSSSQPSQPAQAPAKIVVFAAASLKPAFTRISQQFKSENPNSSVDFEFAGSSELATQLTQGATADVFASADTAQMDTVAKAGLLAGSPTNFASNTLVIVTAPGNPKKIGAFTDLTRSGL